MSRMPAFHATLAPFTRPLCFECGAPMFIVTVEPNGFGHESRTYECPRCKFIETAVVQC